MCIRLLSPKAIDKLLKKQSIAQSWPFLHYNIHVLFLCTSRVAGTTMKFISDFVWWRDKCNKSKLFNCSFIKFNKNAYAARQDTPTRQSASRAQMRRKDSHSLLPLIDCTFIFSCPHRRQRVPHHAHSCPCPLLLSGICRRKDPFVQHRAMRVLCCYSQLCCLFYLAPSFIFHLIWRLLLARSSFFFTFLVFHNFNKVHWDFFHFFVALSQLLSPWR